MINAKKHGKVIEWERLEISSRKLEIPREHFMQTWAQKGQKWYGPNRSRYRGKNTQNYTKKVLMTSITMMVWSLT